MDLMRLMGNVFSAFGAWAWIAFFYTMARSGTSKGRSPKSIYLWNSLVTVWFSTAFALWRGQHRENRIEAFLYFACLLGLPRFYGAWRAIKDRKKEIDGVGVDRL